MDDRLERAREVISSVDREMARLFVERMNAVKDVAEYKIEHGLPVFDAAQEARVIMRNTALIDDDVLRGHYENFLKAAMAESRAYQRYLMNSMKVAYCGVEGAFAHTAAGRIFPGAERVSFESFEAAYAAVENGECGCAVLPMENSYSGQVGAVSDLLYNGELYVTGMFDLAVSQNLLAVPGANIDDIKTVVSHPHALSQCMPYITSHGFMVEQAENTATAARMTAEKGDISVAAIGSMEAAERWGLNVLEKKINESDKNTTRFGVISKTPNTAPGTGFILLFTVKNTAGALANAAQVIGGCGFNMRALHSRPMKTLPWQHYFYVEAEGDINSEAGKAMLNALGAHCQTLSVQGSFRFAEVSDLEE